MSYHVTILRTRNGKQVPITRDEAASAIAARPDLRATPNARGGLEVTIVAKGAASPRLIWQDGEIWTGNPDDETLQLMLELADGLGARVRGDESETYRTVTETYQHPDDAGDIEIGRRIVASGRRKQWLVNLLPFLFAAVVLLVALWLRR